MTKKKPQNSQLLAQIKEQFDFAPYPKISVEALPSPDKLYIHNLITAYYVRNKQVIDSTNKVILDAGCGTGYKSLMLALANPTAKIIGVDLSEKSVELARQRFAYHGLENGEFYQCDLNEIGQLGFSFDYINCDEVLYLFSDPAKILSGFKSVLNPQGIIRANFHSFNQRFGLFQAQELFKLMGLMDNNPEDMEIEIVVETMQNLKDNVALKQRTWDASYLDENQKERVLMNYLFQGDKGYKITDIFTFLKEANLEFIKMLDWREWDLLDLFKEPDNLPLAWGISIPEMSMEEKLHIFDLLHPVHRLLDFWCGHPEESLSFKPLEEWEENDWQEATIYLHPQLKIEDIKQNMYASVQQLKVLTLRNIVGQQSTNLAHYIISIILPLLESPQPFVKLVERYQKLYPFNPITLESTTDQDAFKIVVDTLTELEGYGYILLD